MTPAGVVVEPHLLGGGDEKIPVLHGLPGEAVEIQQEVERYLPLIVVEVVPDVVGAAAGVTSGVLRHQGDGSAQQLHDRHGHQLPT